MPTPDKLPGIIQTDVNGSDILIINDGGTTKKITLSMLSQYLGTAGVEGSHILRIELTSAAPAGRPGVTDTYTITFREENGDEGTETFEVHNGSNGTNGLDGDKGETGDPGDPVDNVTYTGGDNLGDDTEATFWVNGTEVGTVIIQAGEQGEKGDKGDASEEAGPQGNYYVKLFLRSATQPNTPTDVTWTPGAGRGTLSGANSANWTLTPTSGTIQLWEVEALFNPAGAQDISTWSAVFHAGAEGPAGQRGEALKVAEYNSDTLGTTVSLETAESETAAGTFFVRHGEQGEPGGKGDPGIQGDPGAPVDNVVVDHSAGPGGTTIIHFEVEGEQIGTQVNIPPGERGVQGQQGETGEAGESLKVDRTVPISNGEIEVFLETETTEQLQ